MRQAIQTVISGNDLNPHEAKEAFTAIMDGESTNAQTAAFIVALRMKGESVEEITAAAQVMREKVTLITPQTDQNIVDTCGTGGDGTNTFNISTAAALVAAGAGALVAKHGNRSVSSRSGSADVLEALGVNILINHEQMKTCLEEVGIGFLFAPTLHKAMKYAAEARKEIGVRTIFNILGPMTNPALASRQLLGVFAPHLTHTMASVLKNMGSTRAFVVHGNDSMDEISLSGPTQVSELNDHQIKTYTICPEQFGFERVSNDKLRGGEADTNAQIIRDILNGKKGAARDIVVLNAAFALCAAGMCDEAKQGIRLAADSIDSKAAIQKLKQLIEVSNSFRT
ncbi:Anthranilate phosphoribosyltransferase [Chitinispirillum alkaliphilum]|nr:Anthranilate phosphoribosyltransferase [Chitinispirillum alkaliphilum]